MKLIKNSMLITSALCAQEPLDTIETLDRSTKDRNVTRYTQEIGKHPMPVSSGFSDDLKLDMAIDSNNKMRPDIYVPWMWNRRFETALEYRSTETIEIDNSATSQLNTTLEHTVFKFHALRYTLNSTRNSWQIGVGFGADRFAKVQTGFYGSGALNFVNNIDITVQTLTLQSDATFYDIVEGLSAQVGFIMTPLSQLNVDQNTELTGAINDAAIEQSSEKLNPAYELNMRVGYKMPWGMNISIEGRYQYLPLAYTLKVLNDSLAFVSKDYDVVEQISSIGVKLYWDVSWLGGFLPTIGYREERTDGQNLTDDTSYNWIDKRWIVGLNKLF